jgi:hypothetical protein
MRSEVQQTYLPFSCPDGLKMESEIGVGRNWSWDSAARRAKVRHRLLARLWILGTSILSGRRKSSRASLVVAIERRKHGGGDKINERRQVRGDYITYSQPDRCNAMWTNVVRV